MNPHRRGSAKTVLRLAGVVLLGFLIYYAGPRRLWATLSGAHFGWIALGLILNLPQLGFKALRWQRLVRWQGIRFSYGRALLAYFSALLIGYLTPGRVGEMAKAFALRHEAGIGLARSFSSVVLDRVFDLYLLVVLGLFSFTRFALVGPIVSHAAFASICAIFFTPLLFLNERAARWGCRLVAQIPPFRSKKDWIAAKAGEFASGLSVMTPFRIAECCLLTGASYSIFFFQCYCCGRALNIQLPAIDLVLIMSATNLVGFLPFSISNLGTREASLIFFFRILHPPLSDALAVGWGLSQFFVFVLGGGAIGFICWQIAPMGMRLAVGKARGPNRNSSDIE